MLKKAEMTEHRHLVECGINSYVKLGMPVIPLLRGTEEKRQDSVYSFGAIFI